MRDAPIEKRAGEMVRNQGMWVPVDHARSKLPPSLSTSLISCVTLKSLSFTSDRSIAVIHPLRLV
jgi:hypothetical protein